MQDESKGKKQEAESSQISVTFACVPLDAQPKEACERACLVATRCIPVYEHVKGYDGCMCATYLIYFCVGTL